MDMSSYYSDQFLNYSDHSISYAATSSTEPPATYTDEDEDVVMLASNNPKKRAGRKKFRETRHPVYRGVRRRNSGKWVSEVREPNKKSRIWLGTFLTEEMAARAHDVAAIALRGRSACLNFADSASRLPLPASTDPKDIQKAASLAAEAFRPMLNNRPHYETTLNPTVEEDEEQEQRVPEKVFYTDDEYDFFGMPGLLANMAEGLMLPPPHYFGDDLESVADASLWSHSV